MIGFLTGKIQTKTSSSVILLVGGVGYVVFLPPTYLINLKLNETADFFIHTHIKEDILDLYGFKSEAELSLFKLMTTVSGVGAKTALLVVDRGVDKVKTAIFKADVDFFSSIPRLGKKNSQRIIIELKNKLGGETELDLSTDSSEMTQIIEALQVMGYNRQETSRALREIPPDLSRVEDKIRFTLRFLGKERT